MLSVVVIGVALLVVLVLMNWVAPAPVRPFEPYARAMQASMAAREPRVAYLDQGQSAQAQVCGPAQWPDGPIIGLAGEVLAQVEGRVLDLGAGSGLHALALQARGLEVVALDVEPLMVAIMRAAGVRYAQLGTVAELGEAERGDGFDAILMLGYGLGLAGRPERFGDFFAALEVVLRPGGRVYVSSHGARDAALVDFGARGPARLRFDAVVGEPFDWFWLGQRALRELAAQHGVPVVGMFEDGDDFIAVLSAR